MRLTGLFCAATMLLPMTALAERPNIEPGMWEYNTHTSVAGDFPIPDQEYSNEECLTEDDLGSLDTFMGDLEEACTVRERNIGHDGGNFVVECNQPDGTSFEMTGEMQFNGTSSSGQMSAEMDTPMGPMKMTINMSGRRIGDC